jgi:hypothetical protein
MSEAEICDGHAQEPIESTIPDLTIIQPQRAAEMIGRVALPRRGGSADRFDRHDLMAPRKASIANFLGRFVVASRRTNKISQRRRRRLREPGASSPMQGPHTRRPRNAWPENRCTFGIALALGLVLTSLSSVLQAAPLAFAYEDSAAAGRRDRAIAFLDWAKPITVISIDGSAVDPTIPIRRARLAPGRHVIYFFGTAPAIGDCPPVTGDDLVELEMEEGRSYSIAVKGPESMADYNKQYPDVCPIDLEVSSGDIRVAGPFPSLWASERLARQHEVATDRLSLEWQRLARAAADGDPDAAVDLALWYFLGDAPLSSPDPVAAQAWLIAAAERGVPRAAEMRGHIEPTLTGEQRRAAAALAAHPPLPVVNAQGAAR